MTARQNQPFRATPASAKPASAKPARGQPTRCGLSLVMGLVLAAGAVGCSGSKGAESQFHAMDGTTASLIFYVGHQLPSDDPRLAEDARGKVLACWYRSDVLLNQVDQAIARGSITTEQAHAAFFARGNTHNRLTRFPSLCEDVPRQASRSLGVSTDFTPMCNPGFDKVNAINEQNAPSMNFAGGGNDFLRILLGQAVFGGGGQGGSGGDSTTAATNVVSSAMGAHSRSDGGGGETRAINDGAFRIIFGTLPKLITANGNDRWLRFGLEALGQVLEPNRSFGTVASGVGDSAARIFGRDGAFDINVFGQKMQLRLNDVSRSVQTLLQPRNSSGSPGTDTASAPEASPPSAGPAASPSTTSSPDMASSDFEKAHPKVEMDQLNRIARDVARRVGTSPNVILANRSLTFSECPEIGQ